MTRISKSASLKFALIPGTFALAFTAFVAGPPAAIPAYAAGCQGANSATDGGATSADAGQAAHRRLVEEAKANSGLGTPVFGGIAVGVEKVEHDGYRLRTPVAQTDCLNNAINPITGLLGFDSRSVSYGAIGELDLTKQRMMGSTWKLGGGISGKHVKIEYSGENFEPASAAAGGSPTFGVRTANADIDEHGVLLDGYSLVTFGRSYLLSAASIGFGESKVRNRTFGGLVFTSPDGTAVGAASVAPATFGGGRADTDYFEYRSSTTLGHVFAMGSMQFDLSGSLHYSKFIRDAYTDSAGTVVSDAETSEFSGSINAVAAFPQVTGDIVFTPFIKGGVNHRFDYDSKVTITNPTTGLCAPGGTVDADGCAFTATYDLTSDDTSYRIGGGFSFSRTDNSESGVVDFFYKGAGDFDGYGGRFQYIMKFN